VLTAGDLSGQRTPSEDAKKKKEIKKKKANICFVYGTFVVKTQKVNTANSHEKKRC
jgi:hypothetical protein